MFESRRAFRFGGLEGFESGAVISDGSVATAGLPRWRTVGRPTLPADECLMEL